MAAAVQTMTGGRAARASVSAQARTAERVAALPALTGLRALAALWVVLYHVAISGGPVLAPVVGAGYVAVSLFYVLSGFILAYTYLDADGCMRARVRSFYVARIARLYPGYLAGLALGALPFLWAPMGGAARVLRMALTVGLVQSWAYPLGGVWWNGPAWSVSVEAVFYLLFPALALALARVPRRRLPLCAAACTLLVLGPPLLYMVLHPDGRGAAMFWMPRAPWQVLVRFNAFARLPEFCMGLCLGRLFLAERTRRQTPSGRASWPWTGALASCGALAATYLLLGLPWPYVLLHDGALDALFGLLIYGLATARGPLARILATPAVVLLGEASYATYLLHYPLWHIVMRAVPIPAQAAAKAVYMAAYLLLLGALSVLSLRLIEEPARRALRHRWSGGRR